MTWRCTVAVERPASWNIQRKPVTVVTIAYSPKSRGVRSRAITMMEARFKRNWVACEPMVITVPDTVRPFRSSKRWSVRRCLSFGSLAFSRPSLAPCGVLARAGSATSATLKLLLVMFDKRRAGAAGSGFGPPVSGRPVRAQLRNERSCPSLRSKRQRVADDLVAVSGRPDPSGERKRFEESAAIQLSNKPVVVQEPESFLEHPSKFRIRIFRQAQPLLQDPLHGGKCAVIVAGEKLHQTYPPGRGPVDPDQGLVHKTKSGVEGQSKQQIRIFCHG